MSASGGGDSRKVIIAALAGNLAIAACKFVAAFLSGSASTLAEAVHSLADSGNQGLLLLGLRLSQKDNRDKFAFGRSAEKYFWPFVVSLILFSVGGGLDGEREAFEQAFARALPVRGHDLRLADLQVGVHDFVPRHGVAGRRWLGVVLVAHQCGDLAAQGFAVKA